MAALFGRLSLGLGSILLFCAALAVAWRGSARPVLGNQSLTTIGVVASLLTLASLLFWMTSWSADRWQQLHALWQNGLRRWQATSLPEISWPAFGAYLIVVLAVQGILLRWHGLENRQPVADQADYLRVATLVQQHGGPWRLLQDLYTGAFAEANRHPLYVLLLSLDPCFTTGLLWSAFFAVLTTTTAALWVGWQWSRVAGLLVAALLASNRALLDAGALVACETLLAWLCLLLWIAWWHRWDRDLGKASLLGGLLALAYLTKASAFFFLPPFLGGMLVGIWQAPTWARKRHYSLAMLAFLFGFILTASPLLVRNTIRFGNPLHSYNNQFLFADSFTSVPASAAGSLWQRAQEFSQRHSLGTILRDRLGWGLLMESFIFLRLLGPTPLDSLRLFPGLFFWSLVVLGLSVQPERWRTGSLVAVLLIFWLFFAWYLPIAASDRFLLPILPLLQVIVAVGLARTIAMTMPKR